MNQPPTVSVVIPTWNGVHLLPACLQALHEQQALPDRILIVDNGSTDGTAAWVRVHGGSRTTLLPLGRNRGVAAAFNAGIAASRTTFVALVNNDTIVDPRWLSELTRAMQADERIGSCASKMLFARDRVTINSAGDLFRFDGTPDSRGVWERDRGQYDEPVDVFGASGGAALYRAAALNDVGPFDESFVSYCEDVDWAFRAQLAGYRCRYVPTARAYHVGSATGGGTYASYHCGRNVIATVVKNMPAPLWRRYWRHIVARQFWLALEACRHGREPAARARLRGQGAALRALPRLLASRRRIQAGTRINPMCIAQLLSS